MRSSATLRMSAPAVVAVLCSQVLAGCTCLPVTDSTARPAKPSIPLPHRSLLAGLPQPDCEFREIGLGDTVLDPDGATRRKLDYERQCYRRAEMLARARLRQLQASVAETVKVLKRSEQAAR
jgi:hypothetical protein